MSNVTYREDFTLTLAPGQDMAGYFEILLNVDDTPITYQFGGGFGPKTFAESYTTLSEIERGIEGTFAPIHLFLEDVKRALQLTDLSRLDTKTFDLVFPNTGGDKRGTFQVVVDISAPDVAQFFITLDGTSLTVKRTSLQEIYDDISPLGLHDKALYAHGRLSLSLAQ